ncbi:MAG: FAD:protein FMN transferase [Deltaproteobacteria bacterium]|nr:FAD:protein FMN transferase [Deltaproteobacteria bacterium]
MKTYIKIILTLLLILFLAHAFFKTETSYSGRTMGTWYHIKTVTKFLQKPKDLKKKIDLRLEEINRSMSTFIDNSEISGFNTNHAIGERIRISDDFFHVMTIAQELYKLTGGAWDGTVNPLVNLWGFGRRKKQKAIPEKEKIKSVLTQIGFNNIEISEKKYLRKKIPSISLDLASIAKGYAVDEVARLIKENGTDNFLVEIGGEVYASGRGKDGKNWNVGINTPSKDAVLDQVYKVVPLSNKALATSGDYRNFFEIDGKPYSHIIDPRTGYPVDKGVVGVTIMADSCAFADGLATAVMVLGHAKGLKLVNSLDGVECLIIVEQNNKWINYCSRQFPGF